MLSVANEIFELSVIGLNVIYAECHGANKVCGNYDPLSMTKIKSNQKGRKD